MPRTGSEASVTSPPDAATMPATIEAEATARTGPAGLGTPEAIEVLLRIVWRHAGSGVCDLENGAFTRP